jgi:hypothetical protein
MGCAWEAIEQLGQAADGRRVVSALRLALRVSLCVRVGGLGTLTAPTAATHATATTATTTAAPQGGHRLGLLDHLQGRLTATLQPRSGETTRQESSLES